MDEQKIQRIRESTMGKLARVLATKAPTDEGAAGRIQALVLAAASIHASTQRAGNDPSLFADMALAAIDAFDEAIRRHRSTRN